MNQSQIRYLRVEFEGTLAPWEIPAFRGAMVAKAGRQHDLFHNHQSDGGLHYRYPLIQYKWRGTERRPVLVCLREGVDEVHHFFSRPDWTLQLSGRALPVTIHQLDLRHCALRVLAEPQAYQIRQWVALNQDNAVAYAALKDEAAQRDFLARKLVGNILAFAKGMGWYISEPIKVQLIRLQPPRPVRVKQHQVLSFDADFLVNVALPEFIGLGKHASIGFGVVSSHRVATTND